MLLLTFTAARVDVGWASARVGFNFAAVEKCGVKAASGALHPRFGSRARHLLGSGEIELRHPAQVNRFNGLPVGGWKAGQQWPDAVGEFGQHLEVVIWRALGLHNVVRNLACIASIEIRQCVSRDTKEPRFEPLVVTKLGFGVVGAQEDFLRQVLGILGGGDAVAEKAGETLTKFHKEGDGLARKRRTIGLNYFIRSVVKRNHPTASDSWNHSRSEIQ